MNVARRFPMAVCGTVCITAGLLTAAFATGSQQQLAYPDSNRTAQADAPRSSLMAELSVNQVPTQGIASDFIEVILLRNGGKFVGRVTDLTEHLEVELISGGTIRLSRREVDIRANSLVEAYEILRSRTSETDYRDHLGLASWCLNQSLWVQTYEEIEQARILGAPVELVQRSHERLRQQHSLWQETIKRRAAAAIALADQTPNSLESAQEQPETMPLNVIPDRRSNEREGTVEIGRMVQATRRLAESLDDETQLAFRRDVQPRLVHGCSASNCHGPSGESGFKLERLARGKPISSRMTERNLEAVLALITPSRITDSPLLVAARLPHAGLESAIYPRHLSQHYQDVEQWVIQVSEQLLSRQAVLADTSSSNFEPSDGDRPIQLPSGAMPRGDAIPTIPNISEFRANGAEHDQSPSSSTNPSSIRPVGFDEPLNVPEILDAPETSTLTPPDTVPATERSESSAPNPTSFIPRDAFDPEIFNRYAHGFQPQTTQIAPPEQPNQNNHLELTPRQIVPPNRENDPSDQADKK